MGKALACWISFSAADRVTGSMQLVLPFAFFCYMIAQRGLCLCVLVWPGGIIIRGDGEPREDLRCHAWCQGDVFLLPTWRVTRGKHLTFFLLGCAALLQADAALALGDTGNREPSTGA